MRPIVIAAGGTGGHLFPAEALASALIARGHRVVLMTDARTGARLGPVFSGIEHYVLSGAGLAGRSVPRVVGATAALAMGILQARRTLSRLDAACIVGFGGYPSVPPVVAARLLRRRPAIILHEQNAVLGRANKVCARFADVLALGFASTAGIPAGVRTISTGNPVRPAIRALSGEPYRAPSGHTRLLVLGGSLGARIFSEIVPSAVRLLAARIRDELRVTQQCRLEDIELVQAAYKDIGVHADLAPFFQDVAERLSAAHLVISRAGASSCAEIAIAGKPAILVPLPGAIDDHQAGNARALTGASVIAQPDFSAARLAALISELLAAPELLANAAQRIATAARPGAADELADSVEHWMTRAEAPR